MAPSAVDPVPLYEDRDGMALENLSDDIDAVNVLKANMKREKAMHEQSEFDAETRPNSDNTKRPVTE
jgi:inositol oxygenase